AILLTYGPISPGDIREGGLVLVPTMTSTVQFLESEGFVRRTEDARERRTVLIELSEEGAEYIRETRRRREQWIQRRHASLTREERQVLSEAEEILRKVVNN